MKVLRICLTYPHDNTPGIGLPCYYHSLFSANDEMIIIRKVDGVKFPVRKGVELVEIDVDNPILGKYNESTIKRIWKLFLKGKQQLTFLQKCKPVIKRFNPDIVHIYTPMPILTGLWARKNTGAKLVMSLHGSDILRIKKNRIFDFCMEKPDAVLTVGKTMQDDFKHLKLRSPIVSIGNGVDMSTFTNLHQERNKQFIQVASLRWQKGQDYLFDAFGKFYRKHNDFKLVMVGKGEDKEKLIERARIGGYLEGVVFKGVMSREEVANELNHSFAFILSSVTEGFPKVIIESMATGTPVISTDVGNVADVVRDAGLIVPSKDTEALYEAMEKIITSRDSWDMLSKKSETYAQDYTWENVEKRLNNIYDELLCKK